MAHSVSAILGRLRAGANQSPASVRVPNEHVRDAPAPEPLVSGEHYFAVRVEELQLQYGRRWWTEVTPMVGVVTTFNYAGVQRDLPVVVGPSQLKVSGQNAPARVTFRDIQVAGPHPFIGGPLSLAVVLYEVPANDSAQQILEAVETTSTALPFATALVPYLSVADAVVRGLGVLLDVGQTRSVMGCRHDAMGDDLATRPGYFALVSDPKLRSADLWVVEGGLCVGSDAASARKPECDYVLYRLYATTRRDDAEHLPFITSLHERLVRFASMPDDASWATAKTNLATLGQELVLSADLVRAQAQELYRTYLAEARSLREQARELAHLGGPADEGEDAVLRSLSSAALDLG